MTDDVTGMGHTHSSAGIFLSSLGTSLPHVCRWPRLSNCWHAPSVTGPEVKNATVMRNDAVLVDGTLLEVDPPCFKELKVGVKGSLHCQLLALELLEFGHHAVTVGVQITQWFG